MTIKKLATCALIWLIVLLQLGTPALAAVSQNLFVTVQTPKFPKVQITNGNGTTLQTLYACSANGSKVTGMWVTSTDTSARDVQIAVLNTQTYNLTTVTVAINAGSVAGTPAINLMSAANWPGLPVDSDNNPFFYCGSGDTLQAGAVVTLTSGKFLNVMLVVADF